MNVNIPNTPSAMKSMITRYADGLLVTALFTLIIIFNSPTANGQVPITITGHVYVPLGTAGSTSAWLSACNGEQMAIEFSKTGKFVVGVPANDTCTL